MCTAIYVTNGLLLWFWFTLVVGGGSSNRLSIDVFALVAMRCRACLTVTSYCLFSTFNKNFKWRPLQVRAHCFIRCHLHAFGCQGAKLSFQTFMTHLLWENPCFSYLWLLWWCYLLPLSWQSPDLIYLEQYCATSLLCWCDLLTASCSP